MTAAPTILAPSTAAVVRAPAEPSSWIRRVTECATQEPLIDTKSSLESLQNADPTRPPEAIFLGIGLCAREELSKAVPVDLLGVLLPAEAVRRAVGARELVVVVADRHAVANGFEPDRVEERARAVDRVLTRARARCRFRSMSILRASSFHDRPGYRSALATIRARVGPACHDYVARQLADALYLERERGALLKVGWALRGGEALRARDEVVLDAALRSAVGDRIGFVYCKPGRTLADEAPRMPPYVVKRPEARLCLDRPERPEAKLRRAEEYASAETVSACRKHLRRMLYTFGRMVEPLPRGPLEAKLNRLVREMGSPQVVSETREHDE